MIQNQEGLTVKQRLELWDQQFTLSVTRWTPLGILGALSYLYGAYSWSGEKDYSVRLQELDDAHLGWRRMLGMIPLTVALIFPVVGKLKKLKSLPSEQLKDRSSEVKRTVAQWDRRHWAVSRAADSAFWGHLRCCSAPAPLIVPAPCIATNNSEAAQRRVLSGSILSIGLQRLLEWPVDHL